MKKLITTLFLLATLAESFAQTSLIGTGANTNKLNIPNVASGIKLYQLQGYNSGVNQYLHVFTHTNDVPATNATPRMTFTCPAATNYCITFNGGLDLGSTVIVCNSASPLTFTNGATNMTIQAIIRR